ncbi:MAG: response regulator [Lachnospiraceae bacterium]|nr:response regulator [Lachnospiraceae bacterium]
MYTLFAETLRKLRIEKGLSQKQLGDMLYIDQSTVARWESGLRLPETMMIPRLVKCLGVDANTLFNLVEGSDFFPNVIMVDDDEIILSHALNVLKEVLPDATITGFIWPQEAVEYAKANQVDLAILDIELGTASGLDLCHTLLEINPCTNVVFLTAYPEYSIDAWSTEAHGFILKPLTPEGVKEQLKKLRIPYPAGGAEA